MLAIRVGMLLVLSLLPWLATFAQSRPPPDPTRDRIMVNAGFLQAHPDLRYRLLGLKAYRDGGHAKALRWFRRAAYYADKPSQGMVAEMLWKGEGAARDRALAYAWMDLAAEREYAGFAGLRERYWNELDATERARALELGREVYAKYGDDVARPRIDRALRQGRAQATGSRLGTVGSLKILVPGPGGMMEEIDGSRFYDPRWWDPAQYQAWHDAVWRRPRIGTVSVGELEAAGRAEATVPEEPGEDEVPEPR